jgi:prepilin-type N-terminal cleavage/methylation domain-containing protein
VKRTVNCKRLGFSLLEVVIVVAILAILAAIGIPRMSRGSRGASDSALKSNLSLMRNGIDLYSAEHNGDFPAVATFPNQLSQFTDSAGGTSATKDSTHIYGPYLRAIPTLTVGAQKGKSAVSADGSDPNDGWVYTAGSGAIVSNTDANEVDDAGVLYNTY